MNRTKLIEKNVKKCQGATSNHCNVFDVLDYLLNVILLRDTALAKTWTSAKLASRCWTRWKIISLSSIGATSTFLFWCSLMSQFDMKKMEIVNKDSRDAKFILYQKSFSSSANSIETLLWHNINT
jgi:hypothetical protein